MVRFTTKRIESMTLGEKIRKAREERRLTLNEVSRNTNVQVKYLQALEDGNYSKLPAEVYVKGFIRNYAGFLGVDPQALVRQYEKERKIEKNIRKEEDDNKEVQPVKFSGLIITPKIIIIIFGVLFVLSGFAYLYRQVNNFVSTPRLVILKPVDGEEIHGRVITVSGVAEKDSKVTINGQSILVNEKGEFSEEIGLGEGLNTIAASAKNKFDKETNQSVSVNAIYENAPDDGEKKDASIEENGKFLLELRVISRPVQITVEADGNLMYNGVLAPDDVRKFEAKEKISITSANGDETMVKFDGKDEEKLSDEKGAARDIIFTPDGRAKQ